MQQLMEMLKRIFNAILNLFGAGDKMPGREEPKPPPESRDFRELPDGTKLPAPYDRNELTQLIQAVQSASDPDERFVYDTVLVSALEGIRPLLELYDLIPRIWAGDSRAEAEFNRIISRHSEGINVRSYEERAERGMQTMRGEIPLPGGGEAPCGPLFFLKPDRLFSIQQTAVFLAGDDEKQHLYSLAAIDKMWDRTLCPDRFNSLVYQDQLDGGRRLQARLRGHAEQSEYFGRVETLREQRAEANMGYGGLTQPPPGEGGPWRPPRPGTGGPPVGCGPDDGPIPEGPDFPEKCNPIRDYCRDFVRGAGRRIRRVPDSVSTGEIDGISTDRACSGQTVTINGSGFGTEQGDREVVFGTDPAEVISWSDSEIVVRVPSGISGRRCIGIRDEEAELQRREVYDTNRAAFEEFSEGARVCLGQPRDVGMLPYRPDTPECRDINVINIGAPSVYFRVNGGQSVTVEAGDDIVLNWAVTNADSIQISRVGSVGPSANISNPAPVGQQNIGPFNAGSEVTATYRIEASNSCGTVTEIVSAKAVRTPDLEILGIEVTQPIQRFNWNNPGQNNSVRLVSEKRTMVRVYVDSGVSDGFDFGEGANILPDVTGHLELTYPDGNSVTVNNILNPGDTMNAQPPGNVDREELDHSLNFELPVADLDGTIEIEAEVYTEPRDGGGRWDRTQTSATFRHNGRLRLVAILVNDTINNISAPTMNDYNISLQGARTRLPVREQGFLLFRAPNHRTINTQSDEDLTTGDGWSNLLDRIDDIADDYEENNEIWTALIPNSGTYSWNGLANDGVIPFWWDDHPRMISRARQGATFAHELTHTVSVDHAPSVNAGANPGVDSCGNPDGVDNSLVSLTEDVGMDVAAYRLMPDSIPTLMTYCTPDIDGTQSYQDRWMSIDLWNRLWNRI
ncbi:IPT/TIG domain-containing protein [Halalkalibaculum sp. DA3122]|uniref:IPT/TIG domain-containing protein n=1 Tax=Halalkalibaculum sp. DA3122 TaxID=3373607 RepID=UPI00375432E0